MYQTPGVYYEKADVGPQTILGLRTDIAGFVGIAERGAADVAVPIESWRQFASRFGGFIGGGYLAYAVRAFFENGGRRCYVVRVASDDPVTGRAAAIVTIKDGATPANPVWTLCASSPGVWGNRLEARLIETRRAQTRTMPGGVLGAVEAGSLRVAQIVGFERGTLVRLHQGGNEAFFVVAGADPFDNILYFRSPVAEKQLLYRDEVFYGAGGFDPARPIEIESVEYTLAVSEAGNLVAQYEGLSLIEEHPRYGPGLLSAGAAANSAAPALLMEERSEAARRDLPNLRRPVGGAIRPVGGRDGLTGLTVADFIGEPLMPRDGDDDRARKTRGLRAIEIVDEIGIICCPDIHIQPAETPRIEPIPCVPNPCPPNAPEPVAAPPPPTTAELPPRFSDSDIYRVQSEMIAQCEMLRYRFAVLDAPASAAVAAPGLRAVQGWRSRFETKFAALYTPWLEVVDPLRSGGNPNAGGNGIGPTRRVPPCGHVAGQMARTDAEIGVHRAPANAPLIWAQGVSQGIGEEMHGALNEIGVNALRALPNRGLRIMGARTLSSDSDWRYVPVRRLMSKIEKSLYVGLQWAAFEPNTELTWIHIRLAVTGLLLSFFQQGALAGATMNQAFFVRCDATNNPPSERDLGNLNVDVGVAPVTPMEFIIVRVGRVANAFEISSGVAGGG